MSGSLDPQYHREPGSKWPGFLVNRSGLPISEETWTQVWPVAAQEKLYFTIFPPQIWEFAAHLYPENRADIQQIRHSEELQEIPLATPPPIYLTKEIFQTRKSVIN